MRKAFWPLWLCIGVLQAQDIYTTGTPFNLYFTPFSLRIGDFNKDGFMDVVTSGKNDLDGSGIISVLFGKGDGTFKNKIDLPSEKYAMDIQVADMDNDGYVDIVTANPTAQTLSIYSNQKGAGFKQKDPVKIKGEPSFIGIGDFDKDGKQDIAVVVRSTKELIMYKGPSYKLAATKVLDDVPSQMRVDDFSGSGYSHIIMTYENTSYISLISAAENKNFKWEFVFSKLDMLTAPEFTYLADADNDSFDDAYLFKKADGKIVVTLSQNNGLLLNKHWDLKVPAGTTAFCVGDFNNDRKTDIALLDSANAQVAIYVNQHPLPSPQNHFSQGKLVVAYDADFSKPTNADVTMLASYKSVSMYLYYPDGKPARKYFDLDSDLSDGQFTIEWTGTDENDAELPAGEYFFYYKLGGIIIIRGLKK